MRCRIYDLAKGKKGPIPARGDSFLLHLTISDSFRAGNTWPAHGKLRCTQKGLVYDHFPAGLTFPGVVVEVDVGVHKFQVEQRENGSRHVRRVDTRKRVNRESAEL